MNTNHHLPESTSSAACDAVAPLLPLVAQRLLEADEAEAVQAHVSGCDSCRARLAAYDWLDHALRRSFEQSASPPIRMEELMNRIHDEEQLPLRTKQLPPLGHVPAAPIHAPRRSRRRLFSWVAAIAAVLVIALMTTALVASRHPLATGKRAVQASPTPGQQAAPPSGIYFTVLSGSGPTGRLILSALNPADGSVRWQYAIPAGVDNTSPVIDHGVLYFIDQVGAELGQGVKSERNAVYALRASDGKELWHTQITYVANLLWVVEGVVYTATVGGVVYALNASNGSVKWRASVGDAADVRQVVDGVVYADTYHTVSDGSVTGKLYALNASDGSQKWQFDLHGDTGPIQVFNGQVAVLDTKAVTESSGGMNFRSILHWFTVLNASDGSVRWQYQGDPSTLADAFEAQNTVYVSLVSGSGNQQQTTALQALNASDGTLRWQKPYADFSLLSPDEVAPDGQIYLAVGGTTIAALGSQDGTERWRTPPGALPLGYPAMEADGVLYVVTRTALDALNTRDGSVMWHYPVGAGVTVDGISNHVVYGSFTEYAAEQHTWQGSIFALDANTGQLIWHYDRDVQMGPSTVG